MAAQKTRLSPSEVAVTATRRRSAFRGGHPKLSASVCPDFFQPILTAMVFRSGVTTLFLTRLPIMKISRTDAIYLFEHGHNCGLRHVVPHCCNHRRLALLTREPVHSSPLSQDGQLCHVPSQRHAVRLCYHVSAALLIDGLIEINLLCHGESPL